MLQLDLEPPVICPRLLPRNLAAPHLRAQDHALQARREAEAAHAG